MARNFNGSTDQIQGSVVATTATNNVTLSAWINPASQAADNGIFQNGQGATGYAIIRRSSVSNQLCYLKAGLGFLNSTYVIVNGVWTHVAITSAGTTVTFYANGVSQGTTALGTAPSTPATGINIGRADASGNFYKGSLADIAIWNVALTATEIAGLGTGIRPYNIREQSLVGYWPVDGLASPEPDLSGFAHNGTVTGTTLVAGPPFAPFTPRWPMGAILPAPIPPPSILLAQACL